MLHFCYWILGITMYVIVRLCSCVYTLLYVCVNVILLYKKAVTSIKYRAPIPLSLHLCCFLPKFEAFWSRDWFTVLTTNPSRPVCLYAITAALTDLNDSKPDTLKPSHCSWLIISSLAICRHWRLGQVCNWINACDLQCRERPNANVQGVLRCDE